MRTVVRTLSDFADRALDTAIRAAITKRVEDAAPDGFVALALGKQGARELNYSSDIDPILLFDPDTLPRRDRDEPGEVAQRYAREIVALLSNVTEHGYVFRVDLRLRPASETSPLAVPVARALSHYESSALTWERLALSARPCRRRRYRKGRGVPADHHAVRVAAQPGFRHHRRNRPADRTYPRQP